MKRYFSLIGMIILIIGVIGTLFFFMLKQDNSYITYIKIQVNPSFIIGINEKKNVVFYNALNEDGNKYNLMMFQGKSLDEAVKIFIEKLGIAKDNKDEINVTIMTKNYHTKEEIFNIINSSVINYDNNYKIVLHEPTIDEMERYSSEVVYNLKPSLTNNNLKEFGNKVYQIIDSYVLNKIEQINVIDNNEIDMIKELDENEIFNDYNLVKISDDELKMLEKSYYRVNFIYNEDLTYSYTISLFLDVEKNIINENNIVEEYVYQYEKGEEKDLIKNLKICYYKY